MCPMPPSCSALSPPPLFWPLCGPPGEPWCGSTRLQKQAVGQVLIMGLYILLVDLNPADKHSLGSWEEALGGVYGRRKWLLVLSTTPTWHTFETPSDFLASLVCVCVGGGGQFLASGSISAHLLLRQEIQTHPSRRAPTGRQPQGSEESSGRGLLKPAARATLQFSL